MLYSHMNTLISSLMLQKWYFEDSEWLSLCVTTFPPPLICSLWTWFYFWSLQMSYFSPFFLIICPKFKPFYFSLGTSVTCDSSFSHFQVSFPQSVSLLPWPWALVPTRKFWHFLFCSVWKWANSYILPKHTVTEWERLGAYETLYLFCSFKDYPFWCFCEVLFFPTWKYPDIPGRPVVKTAHFNCRGQGFDL